MKIIPAQHEAEKNNSKRIIYPELSTIDQIEKLLPVFDSYAQVLFSLQGKLMHISQTELLANTPELVNLINFHFLCVHEKQSTNYSLEYERIRIKSKRSNNFRTGD